MRPGPATRAAFVRGFLLAFVTAWRRNDRFSPSALVFENERAPHLPKPVADSPSCDHEPATAAAASGPVPAPKSRTGRRPQCPGNQSRFARFWIPRQLTFKNHRLPLALPQSSGKLRNSHVSLNTLSQIAAPRNRKNFPLVKKLWTM